MTGNQCAFASRLGSLVVLLGGSLCVIVSLLLCYCRSSLCYCIVIASFCFEDFFHFPIIAHSSPVRSARIIMRVRFEYAVIRPQVPYKSHRRICARKSDSPLVAHHRSPPTARARVSSLRSRKDSRVRAHEKFGLHRRVSKQLCDIINVVGHEYPGKYKKECVCICAITKQIADSGDSQLGSTAK